jgi:dsRNA-specific ribonuclease
MVEALTTPTAVRGFNYERLEFMGDSIISFLVILELFLTKSFIYKEGALDFYRISTVSNMNFTKISRSNNFYKYMISEPQKVLNNFTPSGFDKFYYHTMIKDRSINELENKIVYLKIQ